MKIRLGEKEGALDLASKAEQCMDMGRRAQRIECGLLFAEYIISKDRIDLVKSVEMQDLSAALKTASDEAVALKGKLPEAAKKEADRLEKEARRLNEDIRSRWITKKAKPTASDLDGLRKKTASIRKHMESIWMTARYTCSIPRPLPPSRPAPATPPPFSVSPSVAGRRR